MRTCTQKGYNVIMSFEGCALRAYRDIVGVPTIGLGITNADKGAVARIGKIIPGKTVITMEQALDLFYDAIDNRYSPAVERALPNATPQEHDGGSSFDYNTGAINRASWVPALRRHDMARVRRSIMSWNHAGGKVVRGLTRRRAREYEIIAHGDYGPEAETPPILLDAKGRPAGRMTSVPVTTTVRNRAGDKRKINVMKSVQVSSLVLQSEGHTSDEIKETQEKLAKLGYYHGRIDGLFGPKTKKAVADFQAHHPNLSSDGGVGPATNAAITRSTDLKRKTGRVVKAGAALATGTGAASAFGVLKAAIPVIIMIGAVGAMAWIAFKYRDEVRRWFNAKLGKNVL